MAANPWRQDPNLIFDGFVNTPVGTNTDASTGTHTVVDDLYGSEELQFMDDLYSGLSQEALQQHLSSISKFVK
jgi:hypothetical protein